MKTSTTIKNQTPEVDNCVVDLLEDLGHVTDTNHFIINFRHSQVSVITISSELTNYWKEQPKRLTDHIAL